MTTRVPTLNGITLNKHLADVSGCEISVFPLQQMEPGQIAEWEDLEKRALEPNAFLSPDFVVPWEKYLRPNEKTWVISVRTPSEVGALVGLAVFEECRASWRFPFSHLRAYKSPHSYLSGMLVDGDYEPQVMDALASFLWQNRFRWFGVKVEDLPWQGATARAFRGLEERDLLAWFPDWYNQRACLELRSLDGDTGFLPKKLKKNVRRCRRKLSEMGSVSWRYVTEQAHVLEAADVFLHLEHAGWKGMRQTSLLANQNHEVFFREMVAGMAGKNRVFFTELLLDGRVIASTCNFLSGRVAFAYKIAWDKELANCSPGILNEVEFLERIGDLKGMMDSIDSGSVDGAYIDKLWSDRKELASGVFVTNRMAIPYMRGLSLLRKAKQWTGRVVLHLGQWT